MRIFRESSIYKDVQGDCKKYFTAGEYILADKAYPVLPWCIPPFINRAGITARQRKFNQVHASTRQVIERTFALYFGRFRRLQYLDMERIDLIPATIIAACILHNVCLLGADDEIDHYTAEGTAFLQRLDNEAAEVGGAIPVAANLHADVDGEILRNIIAEIMS